MVVAVSAARFRAGARVRAGVYARISSDREADGLAVDRQLADCRRLAERKGWPVAEEYIDDDVSAWKLGGKRPEYARMLADIDSGAINAVLVYDLDRLHRQMGALEELIVLCAAKGITNVASVSGDLDLTTTDGQFRARILVAVATKESDDKSRRITRKHEEIADAGRWSGGGSRPFGYEPGGMVVRESEAVVVRDLAARFIAGEKLRPLCVDLNARGVRAASGGEWSMQSLRRMLGSGRIAGQREHKGEIVADAVWPAIITPEQSATIRAMLADPERRTSRGGSRYLLAGLVRCGLCGAKMVARPRAGGQRRYACVTDPGSGGCGRMTVNADPLEALMVEAVLHRLDSPEIAESLKAKRGMAPEAVRFRTEIDEGQAQLAELGEAFANKLIGMAELAAARKVIDARVDAARKQLAKVTRTGALDEYVGHGHETRARWRTFDLSRQQAIMAAMLERVVISTAPRPGSNRFDENRVSADWHA